jgi:hypothetical protein
LAILPLTISTTSNPDGFGSLPGSVSNGNLTYQRQMEFGIRLSF